MAEGCLPALASCALLAAACAGGTQTNASANQVTGSVHGQPLAAVQAAAAAHLAPSDATSDFTRLSVTLTTASAYSCTALFSELPRSARTLSLGLTTIAQKSHELPSATGDYLVTETPGPDGNYAIAVYGESDAQCQAVKSAQTLGSTGTVHVLKLSSAPGGEVSGTFDLILDTGERVSGSFDTFTCAASGSDAGSCQ